MIITLYKVIDFNEKKYFQSLEEAKASMSPGSQLRNVACYKEPSSDVYYELTKLKLSSIYWQGNHRLGDDSSVEIYIPQQSGLVTAYLSLRRVGWDIGSCSIYTITSDGMPTQPRVYGSDIEYSWTKNCVIDSNRDSFNCYYYDDKDVISQDLIKLNTPTLQLDTPSLRMRF